MRKVEIFSSINIKIKKVPLIEPSSSIHCNILFNCSLREICRGAVSKEAVSILFCFFL